MKRRLMAFLTVIIMLFSMVGCSKEGLALMDEMNKVSSWEGENISATMTMAAEVQGMKMDMKLDIAGWVNATTLQGELEMNLKEIKLNGEAIPGMKLSPIKAYMDKQIVYISKSYFTELFGLVGAPVPEKLNAIQAEYIGIDTANQVLGIKPLDAKQANSLAMDLVKKTNVNVAIKQDKRNYTLEMNSDQLVDATIAFLNAALNNMDTINKIADTGMTQAEVDKEKESLQAYLLLAKTQIKPMVSGSNLKVNYHFEDNKYASGLDMQIQVASGNEKVLASMKFDAVATKTEKKEFVLPKNVIKLSMEEYMALLGSPVNQGATVEKKESITKGGVNYLPLRAVMSQLGFDVTYDKATQKTFIVISGQKIEANTLIQGGTAYISVAELQKLGFNVQEVETGFIVSL
ncbi:hypothetical protein CS063_13460 [Sporanaerobium hydrogeniformans]|uniref:Uncharacterized protein n=1 Tax=Sporanaerobium hydrogeniformans TaxID=3072179 RepID=A0AC61D934_9FIRM|nr:hypothetical protein [Sporanaerobium hydrogeniformans]PHV69841.1 hypothetical protein CS063_13460 [Sporanaerobium hydrogeniformans]